MKNIGDAIADLSGDFADNPEIGEQGKTVSVFAIKNQNDEFLDDDGDFVYFSDYTQVGDDTNDAQSELESVEDNFPDGGLSVVELKISVSIVEVSDVQTGGDLLNDAYGKVGGQG